MDQSQRLRYVTRFYPHLQGLRLVPLGMVFLITAAWRAGAFRWLPATTGRGSENGFAILFAVALLAALLLGRYYRRRLGGVRSAHRVRGPVLLLGFVLVLSLTVWAQGVLHSTASLPLIVIGTAIGYVGVLDGVVRTHYLLVSTSVLVLAMLGTFGVPPHARDLLCYALTGAGLITIGIGDHLLLLRSLRLVSHVQSV